MKKIGLLSDTHGHLPRQVFHYFEQVDEIWHGGDIGTLSVAEELERFKPFRAVYGNIDGADIRLRYPLHLHFNLEGVGVYMTHIGGYPGKYAAGVKEQLLEHRPKLFICGHSHILKVMPDPALHLLHMNPGACGKQGWHKVQTLLRFELQDGNIQQLEVIELPKQ